MLYEENPKFLSEVISSLIDESTGNSVGVKFFQQQKREGSVPDGLIFQKSFTIYIETKNFNWFYDNQLERHLKELNKEEGLKILVALGPFEGPTKIQFQGIESLCEKQFQGSIVFAAVSFEDFVAAIPLSQLPKNLADAVSDFKNYLDGEGLLPTWKDYLDVVNCATLSHEVTEGGIYMCPATGGSYNHRRCKYFGMYRDKRVEKIALIKAVVEIPTITSPALQWNNTDELEKDLLSIAVAAVKQFRPDECPLRVMILGKTYETKFDKDTPGGMMGSKQYFEIGFLRIESAEELAKALDDKTWSNYADHLD
jgi:hypothetical protein